MVKSAKIKSKKMEFYEKEIFDLMKQVADLKNENKLSKASIDRLNKENIRAKTELYEKESKITEMQDEIEELNVMVKVLSEKYNKVFYADYIINDDEPSAAEDCNNANDVFDVDTQYYPRIQVNYSSDEQDYVPDNYYIFENGMAMHTESLKRDADCTFDSMNECSMKKFKPN